VAPPDGVSPVLSRGSRFASWASGYDDSPLQSVLYEPVCRSVMEQLRLHAPRALRVLDVGCGTGRLLRAAAQRYPLVLGLDPCLEMLEVARSGGASPGRGVVCAMAERLPFPTGTFDVVTSTMSLRHWEDPILGFGELTRVLSGTGTLVVADSQPDPWIRPRRLPWSRRRTGQHLRQMATGHGLEVIDELVAPSLFTVHLLTARHQRSRTDW
jgi:ubiquinone/menaquinone biosynthesis C-methylase UbiE